MAMLRIKQAFFHGKRDLIVFIGITLEGEVRSGMWLDLPRTLRGPGRVQIHSVEPVEFADGRIEMGVTIHFHQLASAPLFEPSMVEGRVLEVL